MKFCRVVTFAEYGIIPLAEGESQATTAMVKGTILNWTSQAAMSKKQAIEMIIELQFLEHHKKLYLGLSSDFGSICSGFMQKFRTALEI